MIASLISKDRSYLKQEPAESSESRNTSSNASTVSNQDLFGHMHPSSSQQQPSEGLIRHSSSSTAEDSPVCSPHPMYLQQQQRNLQQNGHQQHHQQQQGLLPGMYQHPVDITGFLNQQFKSDSFDMSNFFGMSQINGHLQNPVAGMSLQFPHAAPSMPLSNSMQMSVPASTSNNAGNRSNIAPVSTPLAVKSRQRSGSSDNAVKCNFCPKKFGPSQIESHRNECRQTRCHECIDCGKRFKARGGLQQHSRIHLQERAYGCRFCTKRFTQKSHLDQHERIHTGMKPFLCQFCGRSFRQRSQQIGHEATHPQNSQTVNTSLNSSGSNSSGIFSANTTGSESDQSCDGSPTLKDRMSSIQAHNNVVLSMLNAGNSGILNLKPDALDLISGRNNEYNTKQ